MSLAKRLSIAFFLFFVLLPPLSDYKGFTYPRYEDAYWLALNMYHEAGNQSEIGKIAVGIVTLNRTNHRLFNNTIKGVVTARKQFSWYHTKKIHHPQNQKIWNECVRLSILLLTNRYNHDIIDVLDGVTHFHATYVRPAWRKSMIKIIQIDDHVFYRMKQ